MVAPIPGLVAAVIDQFFFANLTLRLRLPSSSIISLRRLASLVHHRWNILFIAELYRLFGAKFITLVNRLDASRGPLSAALEHLVELGFVVKNTGHGHPMRPEYLLTAQGLAIGEECLTLVRILKRRNELDLAFKKWTLPLVVAIGNRSLRFNELRSSLNDATPRAGASWSPPVVCAKYVSKSLSEANISGPH